jgi:hypothetical protein
MRSVANSDRSTWRDMLRRQDPLVFFLGPLVFSLIAAGIAVLLGEPWAGGTAGRPYPVDPNACRDIPDSRDQRWSW